MKKVTNFKLRGFYPSYIYYKFLIDNKGSFPVHKIGERYRKTIIEYYTQSDKKPDELELDFIDTIFLPDNAK